MPKVRGVNRRKWRIRRLHPGLRNWSRWDPSVCGSWLIPCSPGSFSSALHTQLPGGPVCVYHLIVDEIWKDSSIYIDDKMDYTQTTLQIHIVLKDNHDLLYCMPECKQHCVGQQPNTFILFRHVSIPLYLCICVFACLLWCVWGRPSGCSSIDFHFGWYRMSVYQSIQYLPALYLWHTGWSVATCFFFFSEEIWRETSLCVCLCTRMYGCRVRSIHFYWKPLCSRNRGRKEGRQKEKGQEEKGKKRGREEEAESCFSCLACHSSLSCLFRNTLYWCTAVAQFM